MESAGSELNITSATFSRNTVIVDSNCSCSGGIDGLTENAGLESDEPVENGRPENEGTENGGPSIAWCSGGVEDAQPITDYSIPLPTVRDPVTLLIMRILVIIAVIGIAANGLVKHFGYNIAGDFQKDARPTILSTLGYVDGTSKFSVEIRD